MTNLAPRRVVILDTETDSLGADRQPWEFAAYEIRRGMIGPQGAIALVDHFYIDINLTTSDPEALRIGGFYDRHPVGRFMSRLDSDPPANPDQLSNFHSLRGAAVEIARITHGATIVGANPAFDMQMLERIIRSYGFAPGWHYRLRDVESLLAGALGRETLGGLEACAEAAGFTFGPGEQHTAQGDALMAARIYCKVFGLPHGGGSTA